MKKFLLALLFVFPLAAHADTIIASAFLADITLDPGVYVISNNITIPQGVTVTAKPGVIFKFSANGAAALTIDGTLNAEGTGTPVVFTSFEDDIGGDTGSNGTSSSPQVADWLGITVSNSGSFVCSNCLIRYAGHNSSPGIKSTGILNLAGSSIVFNGTIGIWTANGSTTLDYVSVSNNAIGIYQTGGMLTVANSTIDSSTQEGIREDAGISLILNDNTFSGNKQTAIIGEPIDFVHIGNTSNDLSERGFSMSGVFPDGYHLNSIDLPILFIGQPVVAASTTVFIDPGTIIKLGDPFGNGSLSVSGTLIAEGTSISKIYFTSFKDDSVGGDTNGDNNVSNAAPQDWFGLLFEPGSIENFSNTVIRYAGNSANGTYIPGVSAAIYQRGGDFSLEHSLLDKNYGSAIFADAGTVAVSNTEFTNNIEGIESRGGMYSLTNNSFHDQQDQAIYNQTGFPISAWPDTIVQIIDARNNWWGSDSGPNDVGTSSPTGTGDRVGVHVLYNPWLTTNPLLPITSTSTDSTSTSTPDNTGSSTPPTDDASSTPARIPVIVVPGIMSSFLVRDSDSTEVWPGLIQMVGLFDTYLDDLMLDISGQGGAQIDAPTLIKSLPGYNLSQGLFDQLALSGFIENEDVFEFPYDWRLDISQTALALKNKIDAVRAQTGSTKVDLIAHSMGGLVVKSYLKIYGGNDIDTFVDIATPQTGSPSAFKILNYGDDLGFRPLGVSILNQAEIKKVSQNMPAIYELLPSQNYFDNSDPDYSYYVWNGIHTNQSLNFLETKDYLDQNGRNQTLVDTADAFHRQVDNLDPVIGYGVKTYNIIGCGTPTLGQFFILDQKQDGSYDYDLKLINGDGTVPLKSAEAIHALHTYYVKGGVHSTLPSTNGVTELVASLINGDNPDISPYTNLLNSAATCMFPDGKLVSFHSPITLNAYDARGNHAGPDANGDIENNIPGADYETIEDNKFVFLPDGQDYHIVGQATGTGTFDVRIESIVNGEVATTTIFHDVPINQNSQTQFIVGQNVPTDISLDSDGNGTFESTAHQSGVSSGTVESTDQPPAHITQSSSNSPSSSNAPFALLSSSSNRARAIAALVHPVNTAAIKPLALTAVPAFPKNIGISLTPTSTPILKKSSNIASAYGAFTQSLKSVFTSFWSWVKKKF